MAYEMDAGAQSRLGAFFSAIGQALKNKTRMASFATYAMGLFSSLERKSAERSRRPRLRIPRSVSRRTIGCCGSCGTHRGATRT
jgi:hypothetical protein